MKKCVLILLLNVSLFLPGSYTLKQVNAQQQENTRVKEIQPSSSTGTSKAVIVDEVPLNKKGRIANSVSEQIDQLFKNLELILKKAGSSTANIVKINFYIGDDGIMPQLHKKLKNKFSKSIKPAVSFVRGALAHADADISMDVIATSDLQTGEKVKYFRSGNLYDKFETAHVSVLPAGGVTYVSGQADKGDLREATRGTLKQLEATIKHLGITKDQVVQIKSFLQPMVDISIVEKEFSDFFKGMTVPPLVFVDWLSKDPVIEIELIAASPVYTRKNAEQLSFITPPGMVSSPVYSKVSQINHGKKIYVSSLYGGTLNDPVAQTSEIFASLKETLTLAGSDFRQLAKATYYVSDDKASVILNEIRPKFYDPSRPPAASKALVRGTGKSGMNINIDMIGVAR